MVDTPRVELQIGATWTDVSAYVRYEDGIRIERGKRGEGASDLENSTCELNLSNRDGRFSPRHPTSPYYGLIGRNTPLRVSLPFGSSYLRVRAEDGNVVPATAPDASGLDVVGDLDVRLDLDLETWGGTNLCGKYDYPSNGSWFIDTSSGSGAVAFTWTADGTDGNRVTALSTMPLPAPSAAGGRIALRVTLDVDNGASGWTVTFYTADTIDGAWVQLGDAVTGSGVTSVFASTAQLEVGNLSAIDDAGPSGRIRKFELRDGIGGTLVADPDFTAQTAGTTSFADTAGNTWTINAGEIDDRAYRFYGEVSKWPPTRDISGNDKTVAITAAGIARRVKQGQAGLRSSMFREFANPARTGIVAYWPMEDGSEATRIAAAGAGVAPARVSGAPDLGGYEDWTASDPIPIMEDGAIIATVPPHAATGQLSIRMFVFAPADAVTAETSLLQLRTSGTAAVWELRITPTGGLITKAWDDDGNPIDDGPFVDSTSGALDAKFTDAFAARGFTILDLELSDNGAGGLDWRTLIIDFNNTQTINSTIAQIDFEGTISGYTVGAARSVTVGREQGLDGVIVGHLTVADDLTAYAGTLGPITAWNAEDPTDRMARLCEEEEIGFTLVTRGQVGNAVTMGDQVNQTLLELLQEAAASDGGILYETRDQLGFGYRTRLSLYNQADALTLSCAEHELAEALQPVDDDQRTRNDVTVKRVEGSQYRAVQESGPLSVAPPPDGVGPYDTSVDLSLESDVQLPDQAVWRLHLGTTDEARFPKVAVNLAHSSFDAQLRADVLAVDVGDRIVITDPSADLPPDDIEQIVIGYSERLDQFQHTITYVCQPASPWRVGVVEAEGYDRIDTGGTVLADDVSASATALDVWVTDGPVWGDGDAPYDVTVGGEVMTVTAVSASDAMGLQVRDAFERVEATGWGSADTGQAWALEGGAAGDYTTDGDRAAISVDTLGAAFYAPVTQPHTDVDVRVDVRCPTTPAGDSSNAYVMARYDTSSNWYAATAAFGEDGHLYLALERQVNSSFAFVVGQTDTGIVFDTATWYTLRLQTIGTAIKAKIWERGTTEPDWIVTAVDTNLTSGEAVGCRAYVEPGSTVTLPVSLLFDNFFASLPQTLTVTRSVNGVTKAQSAETAVSLAEPVYVAL